MITDNALTKALIPSTASKSRIGLAFTVYRASTGLTVSFRNNQAFVLRATNQHAQSH